MNIALLLFRCARGAAIFGCLGLLLSRCDQTEVWYIACEDSLRPLANTWKSTIEARFPAALVKFRFGNAAFLCQQATLHVPTNLLILPEPAWPAKMAIRNPIVILDSTAIGIACLPNQTSAKSFLLPSHDQSLHLSLKNNHVESHLPQKFIINTGDLIPRELLAGTGQCAFLYEFQANHYQLPFKRLTARTTPVVMVVLQENQALSVFFQDLAEKKLLLE